MNRVLGSRISQGILLFVGYVAAVLALRDANWSFNFYLNRALGFIGPSSTGTLLALLFSALFLTCAVLLFISIWKTQNERKPHVWRATDYSLMVILTYCIVFAGINYALDYARFVEPLLLLPLSAIVYLAVMLFFAETVARIRDKQIRQTLYWPTFFKQYTLKQPIGFLMALLLAGNLFFLLIICPLEILYSRLDFELLFLFVLSALLVIVLYYICRFILSLSEEYEKANVEKIQAERFKVELITNVSHDIRSPLTTIINYVDFLKALPIDNSDYAKYVEVLEKKSSRLKALIDDLMEASKASTGNLSVEKKEIDLVEIIGQITGEFDDKFAERNLTLVISQPSEPVIACADSRHLWRVLENLFGNATKYALQGTRVFAEVTIRDGKPGFTLKNTSQNPLELSGDMLTEQFIRGDRARQTEGSGLGLHIAKSLMELMDGRMTICTNGDLFEVELLFS